MEMNIKDIFKNNEILKKSDNGHEETKGGLQDTESADCNRKMYCPACYKDFYTDSNTCPQCGHLLEEPLADDEEDEYAELLMATRV